MASSLEDERSPRRGFGESCVSHPDGVGRALVGCFWTQEARFKIRGQDFGCLSPEKRVSQAEAVATVRVASVLGASGAFIFWAFV